MTYLSRYTCAAEEGGPGSSSSPDPGSFIVSSLFSFGWSYSSQLSPGQSLGFLLLHHCPQIFSDI